MNQEQDSHEIRDEQARADDLTSAEEVKPAVESRDLIADYPQRRSYLSF